MAAAGGALSEATVGRCMGAISAERALGLKHKHLMINAGRWWGTDTGRCSLMLAFFYIFSKEKPMGRFNEQSFHTNLACHTHFGYYVFVFANLSHFAEF